MESLETDLHVYENLIYMRSLIGENLDVRNGFGATGKKAKLDSFMTLWMKINYRSKT